MSLVRYNPATNGFVPVRFSSLIDKFFSDSVTRWGGSANDFVPTVDVWETEKGYDLHVAVPGMKKEDFKIELNDNYLTVSGERKLQRENKEENFQSVESHYGAFSRSFTLPDVADGSKIKAKYADGILEIHVPKDEKKTLKSTIKID